MVKGRKIITMKKLDPTVIRETKYIAVMVLLLSILMEAVFLIIGKWSLKVLWGNLLGASAAVLNFFFMGIGVQKAVSKDEKQAKNIMKMSQVLRNFMLFAVLAFGILLPCFNIVSLIVPIFFPRIAIALRPLFGKNDE